ncbi:MAG TPA: stage V sporulation protein R [Nitrospinaceae bacterium]|jgi:stage V sporulation protein R|nr:stage V sporulation protein R [Nitrospinaceae bacterium]
MSDWGLSELQEWDETIIALAKSNNLDWFPINYEICDYYEMIGNMSYHGMPSHYNHWSFGKSFERTHQMYNLGAEGLPYELIINSDPSIAYLMRENPLYLQILIMCHCVGHSDFFKNNRMFANTRPDSIVSGMRNAKKRIQGYVENPHIGIHKIEEFLDSLHAVQFHVYRHPKEYISHKEKRDVLLEEINRKISKGEAPDLSQLEKIPTEPEQDLFSFLLEHGKDYEDWELDLIEITKREAYYFMPQIQTKIMNEGWASFWHYKLMHQLDLPQKYHLPFLKSHNQVIQPHVGRINPYNLGFHLFNKIEERYGIDECFIARSASHDESFIRQYLTQEDCEDLNLFAFSNKENHYLIDDVSDEEGWKQVKNALVNQVGANTIPKIYVESIDESNILVLHHEHDGRDLELDYSEKVVGHINTLWKGGLVKLMTIIEEEPFEI